MIIDLFSDKHAPAKEDVLITQETGRIINELQKTIRLYNEVTDPYEIEALIYRMKELELHYSYLIKEAKLGKIVKRNFSAGGIGL